MNASGEVLTFNFSDISYSAPNVNPLPIILVTIKISLTISCIRSNFLIFRKVTKKFSVQTP